jgi:gas vesicle protein
MSDLEKKELALYIPLDKKLIPDGSYASYVGWYRHLFELFRAGKVNRQDLNALTFATDKMAHIINQNVNANVSVSSRTEKEILIDLLKKMPLELQNAIKVWMVEYERSNRLDVTQRSITVTRSDRVDSEQSNP